MKNNLFLTSAFLFVLTMGFTENFPLVFAAESSGGIATDENAAIVIPSEKTDLLDPEHPSNLVDPGEGPATEGELRIDFVSSINFADTEITQTNRQYPSLAQLFHGKTSARGSYIQITDLRQGAPGWSLQLKQMSQFKNSDSIELSGATLSFDKGWANSFSGGSAPSMFQDVISVNEIGSSYLIASASEGTGKGTWFLSFGASDTNSNSQENTLKPLKTKEGKDVIDKVYDKPAFSNSAISLSIPDKTTILPGEYQTELTWILQATP